MKRAGIVLAAAILLLSSFSTVVFAAAPDENPSDSHYASDQILVKFKPDVAPLEVSKIHEKYGGQVEETIPGIGVQVIVAPEGRLQEKFKAYSSDPMVEYAEPDFTVRALGTPNDPYFVEQWGMVKLQAPEAWDITTGSPNIQVAVLDTGVDLDHPDLAPKIVSSIDFSGSSSADDVHGHGTHVAGIAAACTNNGIGVAGVGYDATIMNVKVLADDGTGYLSWIAEGIVWAADNGADVINLSLGGSFGSSTLKDAVNYAWNKGAVVVAAAGNEGSSSPLYPAYYTNCIAVAATNGIDQKASWSNYGDWVDVAAPGVSIISTYIATVNEGYRFFSGTSMASAHVAGLAALVFTTVTDTNGNGRLNDEVRARIESNCDDIGVSGIGFGRVNAYRAVSDGNTSPPQPTTGNVAGRVTDAADGSPIAGATVTDGTRIVTTDADGQYAISDIPEGISTVTASATGYHEASQTTLVSAGETTIADFVLVKLPPAPPEEMWVESITFRVTGGHKVANRLRITVKVVAENKAVSGAQVTLHLTNGVRYWDLSGTTNALGVVRFVVRKPRAGTYVATVTDVVATGYVWNTTRGVTSATYTLASRGGKK